MFVRLAARRQPVTNGEVKAIPLARTLAEPLEATQVFARRLAMAPWTPRTWRAFSIPIWYGLPGLQEDLDRILAALDVREGRGITSAPVDRAREACYQAERELKNFRDRIDAIWTGRRPAAIGGSNLMKELPKMTEASDRLLGTLDQLIDRVGAISQHPDSA
jgi:hypothetical protein